MKYRTSIFIFLFSFVLGGGCNPAGGGAAEKAEQERKKMCEDSKNQPKIKGNPLVKLPIDGTETLKASDFFTGIEPPNRVKSFSLSRPPTLAEGKAGTTIVKGKVDKNTRQAVGRDGFVMDAIEVSVDTDCGPLTAGAELQILPPRPAGSSEGSGRVILALEPLPGEGTTVFVSSDVERDSTGDVAVRREAH
jgi:hypothetical protein